MNAPTVPTKGLMFKIPRYTMVLFIALISLLSLDVFGEYQGFELVIAFLMHNIPTFILIIALVISWKRDWLFAVIFGVLAVAWFLFFGGIELFIAPFDPWELMTLLLPGILLVLASMSAIRYKMVSVQNQEPA